MKNLQVYLERMERGMADKLFFLNEIDMDEVDTIVDFGCADGTLISILRQACPKKRYIGYDISFEMANAFYEKNPETLFFNSFKDLSYVIEEGNHSVLIIFSSVLHELYSYLPETEAKITWRRITSLKNVKYIAIRDMRLDRSEISDSEIWHAHTVAYNQRPEQYKNYFFNRDEEDNEKMLNNILEYFLKFRYVENWDRERDEYYFYPHNFFADPEEFEIMYEESFNIEPQIEDIKNCFGIDLSKVKTHYKKIYKRR